MSMQQQIRAEDRPVLQADRHDDPSPRPTGWDKPAIVHRGAGRGTTVIALFALLTGLGALVVPVGAPLMELIYPENRLVKALNQQSHAMQELKAASEAAVGRLAAQTARIEAIEASLTAAAERLGRLESHVPPAGESAAAAAATPPSDEARLTAMENQASELSARLAAMEPALVIATRRIDSLDTIGSNGKTFSARVDGVETRVGEVAAALTELSGQHKDTADQVRALPARFDEIAHRQAAVDALVTAVGQRVGTVETAAVNASGGHKALRLGVAILQLNNVVQSHRPFIRELTVVTKLWQPAPVIGELEVMAAHGDTGVATIAELRDSFSVILAPKLRSLAAGVDRPFVERMRLWMSSWIAPQVPQVNAPNPVDLVVDATMEKLAEEDVRGAVDHLSSLDGAPATLATRWIVEAKARIALDRAMDTLLSLGLDDLGRVN